MVFKELPQDIQDFLFKRHTHRITGDKDEIVYREEEVIELINYLLHERK